VDDDRRRGEALEACPFPPDRKPPENDALSKILNFYDEVFGNWKVVVSVLSIASLVFAYSLLFMPPPPAPSVSVPDSWGRPFPKYEYAPTEEFVWVPQYENQTVQQGDLVLEGDDVLLIENRTYILDGLLLAKDNAKLVLRNAELYIKERRGGWFWHDILPFLLYMGFNDSAVFEAYNSSVLSEDRLIWIGFFGNSKSFINSSRLDSVSMFGDEDSFFLINNSTLSGINVARKAGCKAVNSEIFSVDCFSILDDMIWPFSQKIWEECRVELWNSSLERLSMKAKNCEASISTPLLGFHRYWNSYELFTGEEVVAFNVTLYNTNLTGPDWGIDLVSGGLRVESPSDVSCVSVQNGSLLVTNRSMDFTRCEDGSLVITSSSINFLRCIGDSIVDIYDSNIRWIEFEHRINANISRSKTNRLILDSYNGMAHFDVSLVKEIELYEKLDAQMEGSVSFRENATREGLYWDSGVITRDFEVWTHAGNWVLPNVHLTLFDKDNKPVWDSKTDRNGIASFNISFCKWWPLYERYKYVNNYEDQWRLEATSGEIVKDATIGLFMTDTPIVFTFPPISEPPFWKHRWLLSSVSVIAIIVVLAGILINYASKQ